MTDQVNLVTDSLESSKVEDATTINKLCSLTIEISKLLGDLNEIEDGFGNSKMDFDPELDVDGQPFNLEFYQKAFKTICRDYGDEVKEDSTSTALNFFSKMIYEVGRDALRAKKAGRPGKWIFRFPQESKSTDAAGERISKPILGCVSVVSNIRGMKVPLPTEGSLELVLTVKQAQLIAMDTLCKLIHSIGYHSENNRMVLTPMTTDCYTPDDIVKIAAELELTVCKVLQVVNCSAYSGGQHTKHGSLNCALVIAAVDAQTRSLDEVDSKALLRTIFRQYRAANKPYDVSVLNVYAKYATGYLPAELLPDNLIKLFNEIQLAKLQASGSGPKTE